MKENSREVLILASVFWKDAFERAVKTFAQTSVAVLALATGVFDADWVQAISAGGLAGVVSLLTSLASKPVGDGDSASLVVATKDKVEVQP
jgi:hypothetical protein